MGQRRRYTEEYCRGAACLVLDTGKRSEQSINNSNSARNWSVPGLKNNVPGAPHPTTANHHPHEMATEIRRLRRQVADL